MQRALFRILLVTALVFSRPVFAEPSAAPAPVHPGLKNTVIMIVRHAEKPANGMELSPVGEKRAEAYVGYFKKLTVDGQALTPDFLIATADSSGSRRPRLTIEPLGKALGLKIDSKYRNKNCRELADELEMQKHGHRILIAWHHGEIPALVEALGADPEKLLPGGKWPGEQFGWVLLLRYDSEGRLEQAQCIHEKLMPGDN